MDAFDNANYGFTYQPGGVNTSSNKPANASEHQPSEMFAWQVCLAKMDAGELEDATNYPDYYINRERILTTLGLGMTKGQNAFPLNDQLFAVAISVQVDGEIQLINNEHPLYDDLALMVAEELLQGKDHGMIVLFPNGKLIPFVPPSNE